MPRFAEVIDEVRAALVARYGPFARGLPEVPGGRFGRIVAAYLEPGLAPRQILRAIEGLDRANLLGPDELAGSDQVELKEAGLGGSGGSLPRWAGPLQKLARAIADRGGVAELELLPTEGLRDWLGAIRGIGPATVEAILLHGFDRAAYPLDRATYRVLMRHGWIDPETPFDEARNTIEGPLADDAAGLVELASGMERVGADYCKPSAPRCTSCPLRPFLPESGAFEPS